MGVGSGQQMHPVCVCRPVGLPADTDIMRLGRETRVCSNCVR